MGSNTDTPPGWAIERARKLVDAEPAYRYDVYGDPKAFFALARYLADHEEPPADPLLAKAREICARVCDDIADANGLKASAEHWRTKYLSGECDRNKDVQFALAELRRGIELGKADNA